MVDFWGGVLQSSRETRDRAITKADHKCNKETTASSTSNAKSKPTLFRSVLNSGNDLITELQSKLNAALSLDVDDGEDDDNGEDDDDDSIFDEEYAKQKHRDSGGDFGGSSSTMSDLGAGGSGASSFSGGRSKVRRWHKIDDLPRRRMRSSRHSKASHQGKLDSVSTTTTTPTKTILHSRNHNRQKAKVIDKELNLYSDAISSTESASETEINEPTTATTTSVESSLAHSASEGSLLSWTSSVSYDSQTEESTAECMEFMKQFVEKLFQNNAGITAEEKAKFGELCQSEVGRLWFARYVNTQRVNNKKVRESTFYSLVQYFAIVLFECAEADDYGPAKSLMNMCFTFYHEVAVPGCEPYKEFLYLYLKDQTIWQSLRFWNAAFFDAVQCERAHRPVATREDVEQYSPEEMTDEKQFQENITFGQLGSFTCNMHAFGLSRELCLEFLRKQSTIANLRSDQVKMLRDNIDRIYRETKAWRT